MSQPIYIPYRDEKREVLSASSFLSTHFGGLSIHWGIERFGFGEYFISKKEGSILIDNECTNKSTVEGVVKKAFLDMLYIENESLKNTKSDLNYEECAAHFRRDEKQVLFWLTPYSQSSDDNYIYHSYFMKDNFEEIKITFSKEKFPSKEQEEDESHVGQLLQTSDWSELFVEAQKITWTRENHTKTAPLENYKEVEFVDMIWKKDTQQMEFLWKTSFDSGAIVLSNNKHLSLIDINTFGKDRSFVLQMVESMMVKAILQDN